MKPFNNILLNTLSLIIIVVMLSFAPASAESNFSGDRLKNAMISYINKIINPDNSKKIEVIFGKNIDNYKFAQDGINAKFNATEKSLVPSSFVAIEFYNNDMLIKRDEYPIRIKIYQDVPVANRRINRGEIIGREDISLTQKDIGIYKNSPIPEINDVVGSVANQNISKDAVITPNSIKTASVGVMRGDNVNVISRSGAVAVSIKGTAMNDAEPGKKVRVKCDSRSGSSSQIIEGVVESPGIVAIYN